MVTQETLRRDVLQYLRQKYSIKIELPSLKRLISDKINLKIFKNPMGQNLAENRYLILINQSQELLRRNIINTEKIKEFGENFFETINQDLMVLQNNEEIRRNFTRMRDQITYQIEQLNVEQKRMEEECKMIADKEDILIFLEGSFKMYLGKVKEVSEHYNGINNAQVYTSINIDTIYSEKLAQEDDYNQHFQPLLEVMQRLKSNMIKLYQELNRCEYYELPLKSVNFLANCKNLLLELEPFLIKSDCVFNRLIFHVTRGQKENNRLISNVFQANIAFTNDIVSDIFKSFFIGHIFKDYYMDILGKIGNERQQLIKYFENRYTNIDNFNSFTYKIEKKLQDISTQIMGLKRIIGVGKDKIMRDYLGRKQCKKGKLLMELEEKSNGIKGLSKTMQQFLKYKNRVQQLVERGSQIERHVEMTVASLKDLETNSIKTSKPVNSNIKQIQSQIYVRIRQSYLMIQDGIVSIHSMLTLLAQAQEEDYDTYFNQNYFPIQQEILKKLASQYSQYEITLLNNYQNLRKEKLQKAEETVQIKSVTFEQLNDYFETKIHAEMGFEIRNQDAESEEVKDNIIKIEKMEFMINNYLTSQNQNEMEELQKHKINLEWLLQVFEGSMDEPIFEKFMQKLNFEVQDWKEQASRVRELIKELARYVNILKGIVRSSSISKISQKVFKLIKNRTQLYEIIQDLYEEFLLIYESCKQQGHLNISDHGLKIFDEPTYKYVLMLYQYKNRMRAEVEEIKDLLLPKKTINYLIDELYQPFISIFNSFSCFSEEELLNFTLRLEHALNLKGSQAQIISLFQQTLAKPYHGDYFQSVLKISEQMVKLKQENSKVIDLQEEEVMIYNLSQFKERCQILREHLLLAEAIARQMPSKNLVLDVEISKVSLQGLCAKVRKQWQLHRGQWQRSVSASRADDDFE